MQNYIPQDGHLVDMVGGQVENAFENQGVVATILAEFRALREAIEKSDEANKKRMKTLTDEIAALRAEVRDLRNPHMQEMDTSLLPTLPFVSFTEFKEFDTMLLVEDEMRTQMKTIIRRVGGRDYASFIRMAIKAIMNDELAVHLSWRGTNEKPSIQLFTCFKLIKDVCHSKYTSATDVEINRIAQQHFLHAKDRVSKRRKCDT